MRRTSALLAGTLVIASVVVFIIRLYRKGLKKDTNGEDSNTTKIINVEMEEQSPAQRGQVPWANPAAAAAAADAYVHMSGVQA